MMIYQNKFKICKTIYSFKSFILKKKNLGLKNTLYLNILQFYKNVDKVKKKILEYLPILYVQNTYYRIIIIFIEEGMPRA